MQDRMLQAMNEVFFEESRLLSEIVLQYIKEGVARFEKYTVTSQFTVLYSASIVRTL